MDGVEQQRPVDHDMRDVLLHPVQDARLVWRGRARTLGPSRSFSLERRISDYPGPDQVTGRAVGPRGITCQATATLPG